MKESVMKERNDNENEEIDVKESNEEKRNIECERALLLASPQ